MLPMPPFRWDLVTPDQLGSLLEDTVEPSLWFLDDLVTCAGKVLARGGDAQLVFVGRSLDVVSRGGTFEKLFSLLDNWIVDSREPWDVIRRQLRFVGVTVKGKTSPNTWRWQQHTDWTARLPARAVQNVSLPYFVWTHFGDHQTKLTRSFRPAAWYADAEGPNRGDQTRQALGETWLRTLVTGLRR